MKAVHVDLERAVERAPSRVELPQGGRRAAVCAIFTRQQDLLLIRRSEYPGDPWSGHMAFPGGRVEAGEQPLDAAMREVREEIGLFLDHAQLVGELDELRTVGPLPPIVIRPYLFVVDEIGDLELNGEIASVHMISIHRLLANVGRGTMRHPWRGTDVTFPRVDFDEQRLWGLTLHMVDDLLHRLDGGGRGLQRVLPGGHDTPWDR
ncbi:MAG: 8-oxo-dGTP pyrophosphatase MutT (NUDIX family) [Kiritimatiellia bacterium]|jgi:8-oxo-dGTP pyrophosphatase MutT (NUDIX family)